MLGSIIYCYSSQLLKHALSELIDGLLAYTIKLSYQLENVLATVNFFEHPSQFFMCSLKACNLRCVSAS